MAASVQHAGRVRVRARRADAAGHAHEHGHGHGHEPVRQTPDSGCRLRPWRELRCMGGVSPGLYALYVPSACRDADEVMGT